MIYFLFTFFLLISSTTFCAASSLEAESSLEYGWSFEDFEDGSQIDTTTKLGSMLSQDFSSQDFNFTAPSTPPHEYEYEHASTTKTPLKITPKKRNIISSITRDVIKDLESLLSSKKNGEIYVNSFFFTNVSLAKTLAKIHIQSNGAIKINVVIDGLSSRSGAEALGVLHNAGIPIYKYRKHGKLNHNKQIFWTYVDEKRKNRYSLCDGSYNYTNLAANNVEQVVIARIKKDTFNRYKKHFYTIVQQSTKYSTAAKAASSVGLQAIENINPTNSASSSSSS